MVGIKDRGGDGLEINCDQTRHPIILFDQTSTQLSVDNHRTASIHPILDMVICEKRQLAFILGYLM
jgi:hypothetical protein